MQSNATLFSPKGKTPDPALKALFLRLLDETERTCKRTCKNTYEQERHSLNTLLPETNATVSRIERAKERILLESGIEKNNQEHLLYEYVSGFYKIPFDFLFLYVFSEKLKKHWLPVAEKYNSHSLANFQNRS